MDDCKYYFLVAVSTDFSPKGGIQNLNHAPQRCSFFVNAPMENEGKRVLPERQQAVKNLLINSMMQKG
jgi:hypothetical protein